MTKILRWMGGIASGAISGVWGYVAAFAALVVGIWAYGRVQRSEGFSDAIQEQRENTLKDVKARKDVDTDVSRLDRGDAARKLFDRWRR